MCLNMKNKPTPVTLTVPKSTGHYGSYTGLYGSDMQS